MKHQFDDMFDEVQRQAELDNWINAKQEAYEDRMVKQVLTSIGLGQLIGGIKRTCKAELGSDTLRFAWFRRDFPDFPVQLGAASTVFSHDIVLSDLFKRLTNTKMFTTFEELEGEVLGESGGKYPPATGLIFPWAHLGHMILHTSTTIEPEGTRVMRSFNNGRSAVFLDTFAGFMAEVNKFWKPTL